jgi:stage II sporulation protein M
MNEKRPKYFIAVSFFVFFLFVLLGFLSALANPQGADLIAKSLTKALGFVKNFTPSSIFLFIFFNNTIKTLLVMLLGMFFGVIPILFLMINGYILGIIAAVKINQGVVKIIAGLLPHGIFELAGIFIACGYGLWLGYKFWRLVRYNESFKQYFIESLINFVKIVLPLLLVAALIETFVTAQIIKLFN